MVQRYEPISRDVISAQPNGSLVEYADYADVKQSLVQMGEVYIETIEREDELKEQVAAYRKMLIDLALAEESSPYEAHRMALKILNAYDADEL